MILAQEWPKRAISLWHCSFKNKIISSLSMSGEATDSQGGLFAFFPTSRGRHLTITVIEYEKSTPWKRDWWNTNARHTLLIAWKSPISNWATSVAACSSLIQQNLSEWTLSKPSLICSSWQRRNWYVNLLLMLHCQSLSVSVMKVSYYQSLWCLFTGYVILSITVMLVYNLFQFCLHDHGQWFRKSMEQMYKSNCNWPLWLYISMGFPACDRTIRDACLLF